jgi:hypothetical protein
MSNAKFDPLEAAKLDGPGVPAKPKRKVEEKPPEPHKTDEPDHPEVRVTPHTPSPQPQAKHTGHTGRFRVTKGKNISWQGSITHLPTGSVVDFSGYGGAPGIARLIEQGIELEPIE